MSRSLSYTYAELEVSSDCYDEIAGKLREAGYAVCFMENGTIDMYGIGLTRATPCYDEDQLRLPVPHAPVMD